MTLQSAEFIRRFLQHVPPPSFHKVRSFGLLAPGNRKLLAQIRLFITSAIPARAAATELTRFNPLQPAQSRICPQCGRESLLLSVILPAHQRSPP